VRSVAAAYLRRLADSPAQLDELMVEIENPRTQMSAGQGVLPDCCRRANAASTSSTPLRIPTS